MASVIRNSPIENLFARPSESLPRRTEAEQSFSDVLSRSERLRGEDRVPAEVSVVDRDASESLRETDSPVEEGAATQGDSEVVAPAESAEPSSEATESRPESVISEKEAEPNTDEDSAADVLNELALALSEGVSQKQKGVEKVLVDSAQAGLGAKPEQNPEASALASQASESGFVSAQVGGEKQSAIQVPPGAVLAAEAEADGKAIAAETPSKSQDKSAGEQPANRAAVNALAGDGAKAAPGQHSSAAFELPGELQAVVDTTASRDTGTKVSVAQQVSAEQRAQSDQEALNTARLHRGLASAVKQNGGAVTLRLTPPEIGTVRIELQMSGTTLSAAFHTETASAMTLINQQLDQLRTSLETQGLNVDKVTVQTMPGAQNQAGASQQEGNARQDSNGRSGQPGSHRDQGSDSGSGDSPREKTNSFTHHLDDASSDAE